MHHDLGFFDSDTGRVECAPNRFAGIFGRTLVPVMTGSTAAARLVPGVQWSRAHPGK
jgi:hypothetical protein